MLPNHVEAQLLQQLQIIDHSLTIRRRIQTIRPEALIQRTKLKYEFAVEEMACDAFNFALGDGTESSVAVDLISRPVAIAQLNSEVV